MKSPDSDSAHDLELRKATAALIRAGARARALALQTHTAVITWKDGKVVRISIPQDPGQAGKSQVLYLTKKLAGYRVTSSPESGDKVTRAEPMAAQINVGNVSMLRAPWNDALVAEMRVFPNGSHDDQIDAGSRAFNELTAKAGPMFISDALLRQI